MMKRIDESMPWKVIFILVAISAGVNYFVG